MILCGSVCIISAISEELVNVFFKFIIALIGVVLYYKKKIKLLEIDTAKQQVEQDNSDNNSNEIENNNGI